MELSVDSLCFFLELLITEFVGGLKLRVRVFQLGLDFDSAVNYHGACMLKLFGSRFHRAGFVCGLLQGGNLGSLSGRWKLSRDFLLISWTRVNRRNRFAGVNWRNRRHGF